jgi:NADH-quinone oxidoreductase subunit C
LADTTATEAPGGGTTDAPGGDATDTPSEGLGAPALSEQAQDLLARLTNALGDSVLEHGSALGGRVVRIAPTAWRRAAETCKNELGCDYLSFVAGIDWMPAPIIAEEGSGDTSAPVQPREMSAGVTGATGRMQVFAHVESTARRETGLTLKTDVDDEAPHAESWVPVYAGADWHEREAWEMFGIVFDGHPSLRHLYLPAEFEGHPLRKDFPLLAREVKPWPGLVDVEPMPGGASDEAADAAGSEAAGTEAAGTEAAEGGATA